MSLSRERVVAAKARADAALHFEGHPDDWDDVAHSVVEDVPVMADALLRVLDLHRRAHAVFSWNSGTKYEDPCPNCDGKAGVHDCGCWADRDIEYVCAECHRLGSRSSGVYDYAWPCATVRAATGDGSSSNTERSE